jgi:hypothetical protein
LFDFLSVGLDLFDLLLLTDLLKLSLLLDILSLLFFNLFLLDLFFLIVLNSLLISEGLSLQSVLELIDGSLLHGIGEKDLRL